LNVQKKLSKMKKEADAVYKSDLEPDEKRQRIDALNRQKFAFVEGIVTRINAAKSREARQ
jgi:hypothetical protein